LPPKSEHIVSRYVFSSFSLEITYGFVEVTIRDRRKAMKKSKKSRTASKARTAKTTKKIATRQTSAGKARAEGIRLFKLAGRPTEADFVLVYGERGPQMTWEERAKAGVPAAKFQAALAAKRPGR
jgi:hypothetical protein